MTDSNGPPIEVGAPEDPNTIATADSPNDTGSHADIFETFAALYGDTRGFLHVGAGADLYWKNAKPNTAAGASGSTNIRQKPIMPPATSPQEQRLTTCTCVAA